MKSIINSINAIFDILWVPLNKTPFIIDILLISGISAVIFLIIFKKTSNQEMIGYYKGRIFAHILEIRLYKDQPILTLKAVIAILKNNLIYLRYSLKPLVIIILPFLIITIQLNNRYGYSPLDRGKSFLIKAEIDRNYVSQISDTIERIRLETSDGILLETQPMRIMSEASIFWRARIVKDDGQRLFCKIIVNNNTTTDYVEKQINAANNKHRFSPVLTKWSLANIFVNNAEKFINETGPIKSVRVNYKRATYPIIAWESDPIILYFILTLLFGFAFKPLVKVDF